MEFYNIEKILKNTRTFRIHAPLDGKKNMRDTYYLFRLETWRYLFGEWV